ncbi:MAG TPA: hypothetical protein VF774_16710, partial [Pseudoduganella sp.]
MAARPPSPFFSVSRICRRLGFTLALALALAPVFALGQQAVEAELANTREMVRFVPDDALQRLRGIEAAARRAPSMTRAEFLSLYSNAKRRTGDPQGALALADELVAQGRAE